MWDGEGFEGSSWREPLQSDLQLAVDWNRPDLAAELFQQDFAKVRVGVDLINTLLTNGFTHHYHLGESTKFLGTSGVILNFYSVFQ